jgi:hypothetical protein
MSRPLTCSRCGTAEAVASFGLCDQCATERTVEERAAQGLPPKIVEPSVYETVGRIFAVEARQAAS